ncbi:MAG TPA: cytochrome c [Acetobacteraceae bacterium]
MTRILALGLLAAPLLAAAPVRAAADPAGEGLFLANCSACHQKHGRGIPKAFPALAGDALVLGAPEGIVRVLLNGRGGMPSFRAQLDDGQLAAIASYVRSAWGNQAGGVPPEAFASVRAAQAAAPAEDRGLQAH